MVRRRHDPLEPIELELQSEKAAALGRIARILEEALAVMAAARARLCAAPAMAPDERAALVAEHNAARETARLYLWYLTVQREAVGLTDHAALERLYRIPAALAP